MERVESLNSTGHVRVFDEMARFSVGGEDDGEQGEPSHRRPKRLRLFDLGEDSDQEHEGNEEGQSEEEEEQDEEEEENEEEEGEDEERTCSNGGGVDGPISVTLTDPEVLDCSICCESLKIPVYQCDSGHIACTGCCMKLKNKCPFCCYSIGYIRCRAIEKVLESIKILCQNSKYGCKETLSYGKKHEHEECCLFAPCSCPLPDCNFSGSYKQLSRHFSSRHSAFPKHFVDSCLFPVTLRKDDKFLILQDEKTSALFILYNNVERLGQAVSISCIGPRSSSKAYGFSYDLIVKKGVSSLRFQSYTGWLDTPSTGALLIPSNLFGSCEQLKLDICIKTYVIYPTGLAD